MGHENAGHYALKHPGEKEDTAIAARLAETAENGKISCADAHAIATAIGKTPDQIGMQADLAELCISRCQLGLFGYFPEKKKLNPDIVVPDPAARILDAAAGLKQRLSCQACWKLAAELGVSRLDMGAFCEKKGIRIKPCQLGAF